MAEPMMGVKGIYITDPIFFYYQKALHHFAIFSNRCHTTKPPTKCIDK